jgi:hypothetical protein
VRNLAILVALMLPATAVADIGVRSVNPTTAKPGQVVRITVAGYLGQRPWRPMPVVLVPQALAPRPYRCRGGFCTPAVVRAALTKAPYRLLGEVRRWQALDETGVNATGELRARIPDVRTGRYLLGLFCSSCTRGPKGSVIIDYRLTLVVRR